MEFLTLNQQFEMRRYKDATESLSRDQAETLLKDAKRLLSSKKQCLKSFLETKTLNFEQDLHNQFKLFTEYNDYKTLTRDHLIEMLLSVMGQIMIVDNALKNAFKGDYVSVDKH
jgi:hypothetical protein